MDELKLKLNILINDIFNNKEEVTILKKYNPGDYLPVCVDILLEKYTAENQDQLYNKFIDIIVITDPQTAVGGLKYLIQKEGLIDHFVRIHKILYKKYQNTAGKIDQIIMNL